MDGRAVLVVPPGDLRFRRSLASGRRHGITGGLGGTVRGVGRWKSPALYDHDRGHYDQVYKEYGFAAVGQPYDSAYPGEPRFIEISLSGRFA
ncbi:hypothetical protein C4900_05920 [Acidiferrobacter thiooxydans]|uniref:Uncharacterized protein n=1 Tax=Acidiferrobacter thiooxydans TaxID=163359 RepID=A0A368HIN9_9GAMM|nr:hypothetical protein C4900_05920 [Acidiferrobacter thiooxydans]